MYHSPAASPRSSAIIMRPRTAHSVPRLWGATYCQSQHPVLDDIRVGDSSANSATMNEDTLQSIRPYLHVLSYGSFPPPPHLARGFLTCSYASFCMRAQLKILSPSTDIFRDVLSALLIGTLGSLP